MEKAFEKQYHELEREHWWFKGRRAYIRQLLKKESKSSKILDIGCSSGILMEELEADGFEAKHIYGIDISDQAIENAHQNGLQQCYLMDAQEIKFDQKFDILIASDCLEHLKKDQQALEKWSQLLNPGGRLYVFVPAYMMLWSQHDVVNMHYRRYTRKELVRKLKTEGFKIKKASYWNFGLFFPVLVLRFFQRLTKPKQKEKDGDLQAGSSFLNSFFLLLIKLENWMLKGISFPFGVSAFCIAEKEV